MTATLTRHADRLTLDCECSADASRMRRLWLDAVTDGQSCGAIPIGVAGRLSTSIDDDSATVTMRGHGDALAWAESALSTLLTRLRFVSKVSSGGNHHG